MDDTTLTPAAQKLIHRAPPSPLGPGSPIPLPDREQVDLSVEDVFAGVKTFDEDAAKCCIAGLLLRYNHLEASHEISNSMDNRTAAYWHAIMHRREPDASNAAYWFRRVGLHPVFNDVLRAVKGIPVAPEIAGAVIVVRGDRWDPVAFIDLCDQARDKGGPLEEFCIAVQEAEWHALFDHSVARAIGVR